MTSDLCAFLARLWCGRALCVHDAPCQKVLVMKCQLPSLRKRWGFRDSRAITFLGQAGAWPHQAARSPCGPGTKCQAARRGTQGSLELGSGGSIWASFPPRAQLSLPERGHSSCRWRSHAGV